MGCLALSIPRATVSLSIYHLFILPFPLQVSIFMLKILLLKVLGPSSCDDQINLLSLFVLRLQSSGRDVAQTTECAMSSFTVTAASVPCSTTRLYHASPAMRVFETITALKLSSNTPVIKTKPTSLVERRLQQTALLCITTVARANYLICYLFSNDFHHVFVHAIKIFSCNKVKITPFIK